MDAKVSPSSDDIALFHPSDPSRKPVITKELTLVARHPGILNYLVAKSNYRCHVWCGPMHAFEQGKLILLPNTLLWSGLGGMLGLILLWLLQVTGKWNVVSDSPPKKGKDVLESSGFLKKLVISRWPQIILTILAMVMIYIAIMTSVFGTKVSGRNLRVLLIWAVWLFLLVALLTPLGGRIWCTVCPLPFFGDLIQRRSFLSPKKGKTGDHNNAYAGWFLPWPKILSNSWLKLFVFLSLATFSTTLVATPRISGITVLMLLLVPTLMSSVWELRAFCRYICPVSAFISPFSGMSVLSLRNRSQKTCDACKPRFCQFGNTNGWGCPYGLNVGNIGENADCGLCLECTRSCTYDNVGLFIRPLAQENTTRNLSEGWLNIAVFTIAIVYSILYLGPWPVLRDYVNILDKHNWDLFGIYSFLLWITVLMIIPSILYLLGLIGKKMARTNFSGREIFMQNAGTLLPLGMMIWIAFVIPMLFVNVTFIKQSLSDPFGWGWDFFGTANSPWHQFLPQYIPWFQAILVLSGMWLSLRNLTRTWYAKGLNPRKVLSVSIPIAFFLIAVAAGMLIFFTN